MNGTGNYHTKTLCKKMLKNVQNPQTEYYRNSPQLPK